MTANRNTSTYNNYMNKKILLTCLVTGALAFGSHLRAQTTTPTPSLPFVEILATDPTALDGTSSGSFTLIRNGDTNADLTVTLDILGSASNGVDYVLIATDVVIPATYLAVDIPVQPVSPLSSPGNKNVILRIETNANYEVGGNRTALVTIIDDIFNNPSPTVTITDPTNTSSFGFPNEITITADASAGGASIQSVGFYADDVFLGRVTNAPYSLTWTNARPGRYMLFARAVDVLGQSALSPLVQITVTDVLPVVAITSPTNGENFSAHEDIPIAADVTDANSSATISNVVFYANGRMVGSATAAPYQIVWSNAPSGFYSLEAAATDNAGQRGYSKPVEINVSKPPR
jgi:hypothetical protein